MSTARCVHCGRRITAGSKRHLWREYTDHVVEEHGKPRKVGDVS